MIDKPGGTQQLHFDDEDDDKDDGEDDEENEPVGGKDRESTVDGFAGEHVLFLLIADQKSTLVISSYWRGKPSNSIPLIIKASHHHHVINNTITAIANIIMKRLKRKTVQLLTTGSFSDHQSRPP